MLSKEQDKHVSTFGIFKSRAALETAIDELQRSGFESGDVSVLMANASDTHEFAHEKNTKAPEGAAAGAGTGAVLGGTLGWLAGIGALAIPGVGPLVAAGPIMAALAGAGVGGAVGSVSGAIIGFGIPEYEAKRYEGSVKEGGMLISVHCSSSDKIKRAKEILEQCGGIDIAASSETKMNTYKGSDNHLSDDMNAHRY